MASLAEAIEYIRLGNRAEGREILEELLEEDEGSDGGWLWMSAVVDDPEERKICLENVVALNPDNSVAQNALKAIAAGKFNLNNMLSEALEFYEGMTEEEEEEDDGQEDDDEDLEMPSTMKGKKGGLNIRLILLGVFALLVVCGLGGAAAYNMLSGGGTPPTSQTPAAAPTAGTGDTAPAEPTATPKPLETATNTPTPTNTPFQLPTAAPTNTPSATATQVVPPTPSK